jgi:hypothetical protein
VVPYLQKSNTFRLATSRPRNPVALVAALFHEWITPVCVMTKTGDSTISAKEVSIAEWSRAGTAALGVGVAVTERAGSEGRVLATAALATASALFSAPAPASSRDRPAQSGA